MRKSIRKSIAVAAAAAMLLTLTAAPAFAVGSLNQNIAAGLGAENYLLYRSNNKDEDSSWTVTRSNGEVISRTVAERESLSRLTDGYLITEEQTSLESRWVDAKWDQPESSRGKYAEFYRDDTREIVLDLGQSSHITGLALHVADCYDYGIYLPLEVRYALSEDNQTFYQVERVSKYQADLDPIALSTSSGEPTMTHYYYKASNLNVNARYVKLYFDVNVNLFIDEFQVFGEKTPGTDPTPLSSYPMFDLNEGVVNAYPISPNESGHEFLVWQGYYTNNKGKQPNGNAIVDGRTLKSQDYLKHVVSYVDENGVSADWLFQNVTLTSHSIDSQGRYLMVNHGVTQAEQYATKESWQEWLDHVFNYPADGGTATGLYNIRALDAAVGAAKQEIAGTPADYKLKIKFTSFAPIHYQSNWGELDGRTIDFTLAGHGWTSGTALTQDIINATVADRVAAMEWYMDTAKRMFDAAGFQNLEFDGFYYSEEVIQLSDDPAAEPTIKAITSMFHNNYPGKKYYWIPFYQAQGYQHWADYGFDYAIMQPNYTFNANSSPDQIEASSALSKQYGMGVEIEEGGDRDLELDGIIVGNRLDRFKEYLTKGSTLGYQGTADTPVYSAWYVEAQFSEWAKKGNAKRYLYDAIYEYVKGRPVVFNPLHGKKLTAGVNGTLTASGKLLLQNIQNNLAILTDGELGNGVWKTNAEEGAVYLNFASNQGSAFTENASVYVQADLGTIHDFSNFEMNFVQWVGAGVEPPEYVKYYVSDNAQDWTLAGTVTVPAITPIKENWNNCLYALDSSISGRYLKAEFIHAPRTADVRYMHLACDELTVSARDTGITGDEPSINPLNGKTLSLDVEGELTETGGAMLDKARSYLAPILTDGKYGKGNWTPNAANGTYVQIINNEGSNYTDGAPIVITADLGTIHKLNELSLHAVENSGWGIGRPEYAKFYTSNDGSSWTLAGTVTEAAISAVSGKDGWYDCAYVLPVDGSARYFKLETNLSFRTDRPEVRWSNLGLDELAFRGTDTGKTEEGESPNPGAELFQDNLLMPEMVSLNALGQIHNQANWNAVQDSLPVLVNGALGNGMPGDTNVFPKNKADAPYVGLTNATNQYGNASGPYELCADLGEQYVIRDILVNFYENTDGNQGNSARPDGLAISVSMDGVEWTSLPVSLTVSLLAPGAVPNDQFNCLYRYESSEGIAARFVKVSFDSTSTIYNNRVPPTLCAWTILDEFAVKGQKQPSV